MSQSGPLNNLQDNPQILTHITTDSGVAVPSLNNLNLFGGSDIHTSALGSTITVAFTGSSGGVTSINATAPLKANGISGSPQTGAVTISLTGSSSISTIDGDSGSISGSIVTLTGGTTGLLFGGVTSTMTMSGTLSGANGGTGVANTGLTINLGSGSSGKVLTSDSSGNGTWQVSSGSGIVTINGDSGLGSGSVTGTTITIDCENATYNCGSSVYFTANSATELLFNVTDTGSNTVIGMGSGTINIGSLNCAVGFQCMPILNAGVGAASGNFAFGTFCLPNLVGGSNNAAIGSGAGTNYTGNESNNFVLGANGTTGESHVIRIGNQGSSTLQQNKCFIAGIIAVTVTSQEFVMINSSTGQLGIQKNFLIWTDVTSGSQTMVALSGYVADKSTLTTFTMPTNNAIGDTIQIVGKGSGGWKIVYATNQRIVFGSVTSTTTTGSLASTNAADCVTLVCTTASATVPIFTVISSIGNITVV